MSIEKTEINIWIFLLKIILVGVTIGLLLNTFTNTTKSSKSVDDNDTDDYNHIDFE